MFLVLGFLLFWGAYKGGFPFFFLFMMILFVCMATRRGGHGGWRHGGCDPHQEPWQGPEQQRPTPPEDARPYQAQPGAPANPYQGGYGPYGNEGTPTVRTDMNSGAGTVRVDNAPGPSGQPTTPLPEQPRARVENDQL
ncbi:MAG TPA: hypothetical protein VF952_11870 [Chloroflexia bacterium]|jgi:hypothetical protein